MGEIHKIGDVYYIKFYARGLLYSQAAGSDKQAAMRMLEKVEAKIAGGEALTIVREIDLDVFGEQFLSQAKEQFSLKSIGRFLSTWNHFKSFLKEEYPPIIKLSHITPLVIESYKTYLAKTQKPKVVNFTLLLLREILEYGIKIGFINDNPTLHTSLLEMKQKQIAKGRRSDLAKDLLQRGLNVGKVSQLFKLKDVARVMYWSNFVPLKREDLHEL